MPRLTWLPALVVLLGAVIAPTPGLAQVAAPDFMFGQPTTSVAIRGMWLAPSEGGDLFPFVRDELTIERGDFRTWGLSADLGLVITARASLVAGIEVSRRSVESEDRRYIGSDGFPIAQSTRLSSQAVQASLKVALLDPGRRISRYAWIPLTLTPFVGAGGGLAHYQFRQHGDFVDYGDLSVFRDTFTLRGWVPSAHVLAGVDVRVWKNVYLAVQGRYVRAHARPGGDFRGFDDLDLSGFRTESGISLIF